MIGHDGVQLAVTVEAGSVPGTILFTHATGFCKELWHPVLDLFDTTRTVASFDTRGHGDSEDPGPPYDWWDLGRDVLHVVSGFGGPVLGVGHSAGAAALVLAELLRPGTFEHLVLVEPIIFPGPAARVEGHPLTEGALRRRPRFPSLKAARGNFAGKPAFARWTSAALDAYVAGGLRQVEGEWELKCSPDSEADFYRGALATGAWDRLAEVAVGVTLVAGQHSDTHTAEFMDRMADQFADPAVVIVPGATHFVPMEAPQAVADLVQALQ